MEFSIKKGDRQVPADRLPTDWKSRSQRRVLFFESKSRVALVYKEGWIIGFNFSRKEAYSPMGHEPRILQPAPAFQLFNSAKAQSESALLECDSWTHTPGVFHFWRCLQISSHLSFSLCAAISAPSLFSPMRNSIKLRRASPSRARWWDGAGKLLTQLIATNPQHVSLFSSTTSSPEEK